MATNNYNPYNYHSYSQSSAQQYSGYQTAPAANTIAQDSSQQYQRAQPAATTQSTDYMTQYASPPYGNQRNAYGGGQSSWAGSSYGASRETTSRAAEVLRNMTNTAYSPNTTATVSQPGFTASNTATAGSATYSTAPSAQQLHRTHHAHSSHSYGQAQAQAQAQAHVQAQAQAQPRPRSVNTNRTQPNPSSRGLPYPAMGAGYPSQRTQNLYNQQPQRSESPAQPEYSHNTTTHVSSARNAPLTATAQYPDYRKRQLPTVEAPRGTQSNTVSTSYTYSDNPVVAPVAQTLAPTNAPEQYNHGAVTVDPMAVYNPYIEYERKEKRRKEEEAARAEEERKAEELRREEERVEEEEQRRAEENERERTRQAAALFQQKASQASDKTPKQQPTVVPTGSSTGTSEAPESSGDIPNALEAEIRAMMAKMRELNGKDPALLARIWEEERRAKVPKSPIAQSKPTPQPVAAQPAQTFVSQAANQRKKASAKEPSNTANTATSRSFTPVATQAPNAKPQAPATTAKPARPAGNTIWPAEKKAQLANAAATYLNGQNPNRPITPQDVLSMLDGSPSYIELCELLEGMPLTLDRAAFAKSLLTAVPDVNSAPRTQAQVVPQSQTPEQPANGPVAQRIQVPPAVTTRKDVATTVAPRPQYASTDFPGSASYPPFPEDKASNSAPHTPVPVAQMVPINPEVKLPANKEQAARKRDFNDLIDLTALSDGEMEPMPKKQNIGSMHSYYSPGPTFDDAMDTNQGNAPRNNFPVSAGVPSHPPHSTDLPSPSPLPANDLKVRNIVQPLDKKKALRRNGYNIKTIARDVLLACGRHPEERQLNAYLDILKTNLPNQVTNDADLSTLRWDLIDPGQPPKGFYRDSVQPLAEDADDENDSDDEEYLRTAAQSRAPHQPIGGVQTASAQALPPTNPFKPKRRGRPPKRHSYPDRQSAPQTPPRDSASSGSNMSSSAPRPSAGSVGYSAFRAATEYSPDGQPLPKKKGRPVGWRKAIHGLAAANAQSAPNGPPPGSNRFAPSQPSILRNVRTGGEEPIEIRSRSPSVMNQAPRYQSFPCKWQNCKAQLHNLETLKKHVHKVHRKETLRGTLECLWGNCGREITNVDPITSMRMERFSPFSFNGEAKWREHLEIRHFSPLSWEYGDGPASGLSDAQENDAYLSDAQGRRVTPRVSADSSLYEASPGRRDRSAVTNPSPAPRGRGRPPKVVQEQQALQTHNELVAHKKRIGGPGIDRGGSTFVNEKRRKGFSDDDQTGDDFVDAED